MKRFFGFLAMLCLFLGVGAQENININTGITAVVPLKIGDKVTDIPIKGVINDSGKTVLQLTDFSGKLLIIDFWATWCSPCVAMIPKIDSLQSVFKDKLQFLPVTYQSKAEVMSFFNKRRNVTGKQDDNLMVVGDKALSRLFPHQSLPHYVWIGSDGIVKAITDQHEVTAAHIRQLLASGGLTVPLKQDVVAKYDHEEPLFSSELINRGPLMRSDLSGYIEGIGTGLYKDVDLDEGQPERRITARNLSMPELFRLAYRKEQKETILEVSAPETLETTRLTGRAYLDWLKDGHGYCYELLLPEKDRGEAYKVMGDQLKGYFSGYTVDLEKRKVNSLVLVRTTQDNKLRTKGGEPSAEIDGYGCNFQSCYLYVFMSRMKVAFRGIPLPLADETGYREMADIKLNANMGSVAEVNRALAVYGLRFEEKPSELEMLVIRERKGNGL